MDLHEDWQAAHAFLLTPMDKLILVTGATGYIASRLIPRLLDSGCRVRCLVRDPLRLNGRGWSRQVDIVQADVTMLSTLAPALEGVHTAYYLIHNMTHGHGYTRLELDGAQNFASAAAEAGIQHIIYLGGLADPGQHIAPHMRSRIETGTTLRKGKTPVTEFRAGVIAGSGSISFEMIRFMTELFPIMPGPMWMKNRAQPIAIQNIIDYLVAALENPNGRGGIFEIGGLDIITYGNLMLRYASARRLKRKLLMLPGIPLWFMAFGVGLMTPVPRLIAYALLAGLANDSVVQHDEALSVFKNIRLIGFDEATLDALQKTNPTVIERVWDDGRPNAKSIKHEGFFINHRETKLNAMMENVFQAITHVVDKPGWHVEEIEQNKRIIICEENHSAGGKWIEWRVRQVNNFTQTTQTVFFSPRGLPGFLYWYLYYPFHHRVFRGLMREIVKHSKYS